MIYLAGESRSASQPSYPRTPSECSQIVNASGTDQIYWFNLQLFLSFSDILGTQCFPRVGTVLVTQWFPPLISRCDYTFWDLILSLYYLWNCNQYSCRAVDWFGSSHFILDVMRVSFQLIATLFPFVMWSCLCWSFYEDSQCITPWAWTSCHNWLQNWKTTYIYK